MPSPYHAKKVYTQSTTFDSRAEYKLHTDYEGLTHHQGRIDYIVEHYYTPDFVTPDGTRIEVKGWMSAEDRAKFKAIKKQYPNVPIVFVFTDKEQTISAASRTTYEKWASKLGYDAYDFETFAENAWRYGLKPKGKRNNK